MIDTTLSSFERDVIDASMEVPVLLDFWAPWCAPCNAMGPMLERLEREYGGRFRLVKVNSDANPELAASFSLKSIPYAVAFVDGNAVAQFSGVQPEAHVRAFLDRLIPNPADLEHRSAREALALDRVDEAEKYLKNAIALDPACDGARLDMIALLLDRGDTEGAKAHYPLLSGKADQQSSFAGVSARMEAVLIAETLPPAESLEARVEADAADLEARLYLAELAIARQDFAEACEQLLEVVRRDRAFGDDAGRRRLLEIFEMAADHEALVSHYRAQLASLLF
jgi:putative thioredoxin